MTSGQDLILSGDVRAQVAQLEDPADVKRFRDQSIAILGFLRKRHAAWEELLPYAEATLVADRRLGAELEMATPPPGGPRLADPQEQVSTRGDLLLRDLSISETQAWRLRKEATVPDASFDAWVAAVKASNGEQELSAAALLALAKGSAAGQSVMQSESNEWYTPPAYIEAARATMGGIDLDPASSSIANETVKAKTFFDAGMNGLAREWPGHVWLNPPYGGLSGQFTERLIAQFDDGITTAAILLLNGNCFDTQWFAPLWEKLLCFTDHRIDFLRPEGAPKSSSTHGSVFVYFGDDDRKFAECFEAFGYVVRRRPR